MTEPVTLTDVYGKTYVDPKHHLKDNQQPITLFDNNGAYDEFYFIDGHVYSRSYDTDGNLVIASFIRDYDDHGNRVNFLH